MVTKYENLFFDMFCDEMFSALDIIGYNGNCGFVDDVSGTEFGNMIKYVFRLLGVESDWTLR